jgi:hypothetical protein
MLLLVGDDDIDVVHTAEAVVHHRKQGVAIWWEIDANYLWAFVGDNIEEAGVLVGEAIVILSPDGGGDENVE